MNTAQIKRFIHESLAMIKLDNNDREDLFFKIGIVESQYEYLYELSGGTARGFWQVEPATAHDNFVHYLNYPNRKKLRDKILQACGIRESAISSIQALEDTLTHNIRFNLYMGVIKIKRVPEPLPPRNNLPAQGHYWDYYYNHPEKGLTGKDFVNIVEDFLS